MPELPEVETVRRTMSRALEGKRIVDAEIVADAIVCGKQPPEAIRAAIVGARVDGVGRRGKVWWIEMDRKPWLFGHLGMAGWIRELGAPTIRLKEHGKAPLDDADGRPRFLKMLLVAEDGARVAFTDGRRLGRLWLCPHPDEDAMVRALGPDTYDQLPTAAEFMDRLRGRKAPIKSLMLDQGLFAGVGNWVADEALFHARINPKRSAGDLDLEEWERLREALRAVLALAVEVGADERLYPEDWLFHTRWGGGKGKETHLGRRLVREQVGGRTTAWIPDLQK
jgi:formamidopyrimidine-DNA glycosylase